MNYSILKKAIVTGFFTCLASGSIQAITWNNYVQQNGEPQVVDGVLDLSGKNLENINFAVIENKKSITRLWLCDNQLESLPTWICQLINLQKLDLRENQLESLPAQIGLLINLQTLLLYDNQLKSLPAQIGLLQNLQELYLRNNKLQSLPPEIGQLKNLQTLCLLGNNLQSLPAEIGLLINLKLLDLRLNNLQSLPPTFSKLKLIICTRNVNIQELQKQFIQNLKGFIFQAIQNNNLVNVRKFTRSIVQRCELEPSDFRDENGNNLLHLAVACNRYTDENHELHVHDPEWKILKELIACNPDAFVRMLQEKNTEGQILLLQNEVGQAELQKILELFKQIETDGEESGKETIKNEGKKEDHS